MSEAKNTAQGPESVQTPVADSLLTEKVILGVTSVGAASLLLLIAGFAKNKPESYQKDSVHAAQPEDLPTPSPNGRHDLPSSH